MFMTVGVVVQPIHKKTQGLYGGSILAGSTRFRYGILVALCGQHYVAEWPRVFPLVDS